MKERNRAQRRHDDRRMYNRAYKMISTWESDPEHLAWRVKRVYNNMKNCSCCMCKSERKNGWSSNKMKLTMQERRAENSFEDGYMFWYEYAKYDFLYEEETDYDYDFWGDWYDQVNLDTLYIKWKYCNQYTDAEYFWEKLKHRQEDYYD